MRIPALLVSAAWIWIAARSINLFFYHSWDHFATARELKLLINGPCKTNPSSISGRVIKCEDARTQYESMPNVFIHSIEKTSRDIVLDTVHGAAYETASALRLIGFVGLAGATVLIGASKYMTYEPKLPVAFSHEFMNVKKPSGAFLEDMDATPLLTSGRRYKND